jgi:hypothetical protein
MLMQNIVMLSFMLSVAINYAECHYAECHYAECHYTARRNAECCGAVLD